MSNWSLTRPTRLWPGAVDSCQVCASSSGATLFTIVQVSKVFDGEIHEKIAGKQGTRTVKKDY